MTSMGRTGIRHPTEPVYVMCPECRNARYVSTVDGVARCLPERGARVPGWYRSVAGLALTVVGRSAVVASAGATRVPVAAVRSGGPAAVRRPGGPVGRLARLDARPVVGPVVGRLGLGAVLGPDHAFAVVGHLVRATGRGGQRLGRRVAVVVESAGEVRLAEAVGRRSARGGPRAVRPARRLPGLRRRVRPRRGGPPGGWRPRGAGPR